MPRVAFLAAAIALLPASLLASETIDYMRQVRPIFQQHCVRCHGADEQNGDLRLDTAASMLQGGNSGSAIVAGRSGESLLIDAVTTGENSSTMPPEGEGDRLTAAELKIIRQWIDQGAKGPADEQAADVSKPKGSDHWAYQPLRRDIQPPALDDPWIRNGIDAFVLEQLRAAKLKPSPEADRATLIRRLSLDLLGLPPSPAETDEFVNDTSPEAYERLVDRLLASPHYGERWGRHWLDLARYADSNGYTIDSGRSIWKYRDWVVEALNRDLPFNEFTIEQIAGDMLPKAALDQIIATGFHRNTQKNEEGGIDKEQFRVEAVVDRVSTTGSVFLGLTVGCARCHDHKYDRVSQREFYQLFAVFNGADEPTLSVPTEQQSKEEPALLAEIEDVRRRIADVDENNAIRQREWEERLAAELAELAKSKTAPDTLGVMEPFRAALKVPAEERTPAQKKLLGEEFKKHDRDRLVIVESLDELLERQKQLKANVTTTLVMKELKQPRDTFVHLRGDFLRPGAKVEPAVPAVLPPLAAAKGKRPTRLDFARWLVDPANPLTPRVTVNRVWQQYFGQGIVATENDFGTQGDRPTHPELLDWLAADFVRGAGGWELGVGDDAAGQSPAPSPQPPTAWSLKALHRLIVTSATYRQSSQGRADVRSRDPYNKLLARQARLRLEAEVIRDSALAASGLLSPTLGGPGVYPPQPDGVFRFTQRAKFWKESTGEDRYRRTLYTYFWRTSPYPLLTTFDAPDAATTCTRRPRSNTPLQALTLANDRGFMELAGGMAKRVLAEAPSGDDGGRLRYAFRLCLVRAPGDGELKDLQKFLARQRQSTDDDVKAWTAVARVLMNTDEFVTRE
ncbi:MAG TPA: PSD1 and planctomycete cytochrome C domain-containing protein [Pirellulales bacterium]|jgi:mono/diheme cytochrome c family protein|nr:PSD1 and planctomycete cytochrome C domain-containing protein [Pirellulales bacterium]